MRIFVVENIIQRDSAILNERYIFCFSNAEDILKGDLKEKIKNIVSYIFGNKQRIDVVNW